MGCVYSNQNKLFNVGKSQNVLSRKSKKSLLFDVVNINDFGVEIANGKIEITDDDLILHQASRSSIVWPLRSLRKYGYDGNLFSFECGRRCATGQGIYAFKCAKAERLFNKLQETIHEQCCHTSPNINQHLLTSVNRLSSPSLSSIQTARIAREKSSKSRTNSLATLPSGSTLSSRQDYMKSMPSVNYISSPFYMNSTYNSQSSTVPTRNSEITKEVNYVNVVATTNKKAKYSKCQQFENQIYNHINHDNLQGIESPGNQLNELINEEKSDNEEDGEDEEKKMNYIVLDLSQNESNVSPPTQAKPPSCIKPFEQEKKLSPSNKSIDLPQSYVTIDFDKTLALSTASFKTHSRGQALLF